MGVSHVARRAVSRGVLHDRCGARPAHEAGDPFVPSARGADAQPRVIEAIDKIDLLFVIDDSGSMRHEQSMLVAEFPPHRTGVASGDVDADGMVDFPPPQDVQFGVISSDLGISGVAGIERCTGFGDDGLLQPASPGHACRADVPASEPLPNAYGLEMQGLNVRCALNPDHLYPVERYVRALSFLREGAPQLVMFAAIVGVPPDRVHGATLDHADPDARDAFYRGPLDDPRMQLRIDTLGTPAPDDDSLETVCETANVEAYPARRIVQVAQAFGENGLVRSICQEGLDEVVGELLGRIAARMRDPG